VQRSGAYHRHVTVQHQDLRARFDPRERLRERVTAAELLGLLDPLEIDSRERRAHLAAAMAVHDENSLRFERASRLEHVREQRPAGKRMQDLRKRGVHALALPGCEHDHGEFHGRDSSIRNPANSLKDHGKPG